MIRSIDLLLASSLLLAGAAPARDGLDAPAGPDGGVQFRRGDANRDGAVNLADAQSILAALFLSPGEPLACLDAADANDDGRVDLSDAVALLDYLFRGALPPPEPFLDCGADPTADGLDCLLYPSCIPLELTSPLTGLRFVYIPPGSFLMGSPEGERGRDANWDGTHPFNWIDDEVLHRVNLTCGFYLSVTEVTQQAFVAVMHFNPNGRSDNLERPATWVSWYDTVNFCRRLSELESVPVGAYRLPTEAEWEYACRAGTTTRFWFGDALQCPDSEIGCIPEILCPELDAYMVWCGSRGYDRAFDLAPVGTRKPNPFGLYNVHGNAAEWVYDWYALYPEHDVTDPTGPAQGTRKVYRGAALDYLNAGRAAKRWAPEPTFKTNYLGFRILRVLDSCQIPISFH